MAMIALATFASVVVAGMVLSQSSPGRENEGPKLGEQRVQSAMNGTMIPILYGQQSFAGNIIWTGPLTEITHTESQEIEGKGGGGGGTVTNTWYSYRGSFAVGLCEGPLPAGALKRIWASDKLIVDTGAATTGLERGKIHIYYGTETQSPSSVIEAFHPGNTPAFRGLMYVVFEDMDLEPYQNQYPMLTFEIEGI